MIPARSRNGPFLFFRVYSEHAVAVARGSHAKQFRAEVRVETGGDVRESTFVACDDEFVILAGPKCVLACVLSALLGDRTSGICNGHVLEDRS